MSKNDGFTFPRVEFPALDAQGSNYASWLESLQASTRAKAHEHYQYSRFIEKSYLIETASGFKTLETMKKKKNVFDAISTRTASVEPSRHTTRSENQLVQETERSDDAQTDSSEEQIVFSDENFFNYQQIKNKIIYFLTIHIYV
jgi:hypothetical protein